MAELLVHFRRVAPGLPDKADIEDRSHRLRPGDVQNVQVNDFDWGKVEREEYVVLKVVGNVATWTHLRDPMTVLLLNPKYDPQRSDMGLDDEFIDAKVSKRRWFIDLKSALNAPMKSNLSDRRQPILDRRAKYGDLSAGVHALQIARENERAAAISALSPIGVSLDGHDATLRSLWRDPFVVDPIHIYERPEPKEVIKTKAWLDYIAILRGYGDDLSLADTTYLNSIRPSGDPS